MQIERPNLDVIGPGRRHRRHMGGPPRSRSVVWIASTHVITTLTYMLAVMLLLGCASNVFFFDRDVSLGSPLLDTGLVIGVMTLAFAFGVFRSLAYIRRTTLMTRPFACSVTANLAFGVPGAALAGTILLASKANVYPDGIIAGFVVSSCILFCVITHRGFMSMARAASRGFEVVMPLPPAPPKEPELPR